MHSAITGVICKVHALTASVLMPPVCHECNEVAICMKLFAHQVHDVFVDMRCSTYYTSVYIEI